LVVGAVQERFAVAAREEEAQVRVKIKISSMAPKIFLSENIVIGSPERLKYDFTP